MTFDAREWAQVLLRSMGYKRTTTVQVTRVMEALLQAHDAGRASVTTPTPAPVSEQGPREATYLERLSAASVADMEMVGSPAPAVEPETKCGTCGGGRVVLREPGLRPCPTCGGSGRRTP